MTMNEDEEDNGYELCFLFNETQVATNERTNERMNEQAAAVFMN